MPRVIAVVVIGILLLVAIVYLVSKASQGLQERARPFGRSCFS